VTANEPLFVSAHIPVVRVSFMSVSGFSTNHVAKYRDLVKAEFPGLQYQPRLVTPLESLTQEGSSAPPSFGPMGFFLPPAFAQPNRPKPGGPRRERSPSRATTRRSTPWATAPTTSRSTRPDDGAAPRNGGSGSPPKALEPSRNVALDHPRLRPPPLPGRRPGTVPGQPMADHWPYHPRLLGP
jgi:hypothetical protein